MSVQVLKYVTVSSLRYHQSILPVHKAPRGESMAHGYQRSYATFFLGMIVLF
jgi:hypothetical protein